ncbi:MAG: hypothetical protein Q8R44_15710 [Novosphingobium sp.]|nr:hypothetical protein [Novosphingobium sp.]
MIAAVSLSTPSGSPTPPSFESFLNLAAARLRLKLIVLAALAIANAEIDWLNENSQREQR